MSTILSTPRHFRWRIVLQRCFALVCNGLQGSEMVLRAASTDHLAIRQWSAASDRPGLSDGNAAITSLGRPDRVSESSQSLQYVLLATISAGNPLRSVNAENVESLPASLTTSSRRFSTIAVTSSDAAFVSVDEAVVLMSLTLFALMARQGASSTCVVQHVTRMTPIAANQKQGRPSVRAASP